MKPEEIKEKIEEIEEKMPRYLAEKDLKNLDVYVYHSAEYTLVEKTLNPFWTWFASCFPDTMAPNMITLIGLLINITASFTVLFNDPTLEGKAPSWMYVLASFALITYLNFDCADGKQARRLHASSPLGQLFDHGCDAINEVFILLTLCSACGTGLNIHSSLVMIIQCTAFSLAQVLEYYINVLVVGNKFFGTTESIILVSLVYLLGGLLGTDKIRTPISSLLPFVHLNMSVAECIMEITNLSMLGTIIYLFSDVVRLGPRVPEGERGGKRLMLFDFYQSCVPSV